MGLDTSRALHISSGPTHATQRIEIVRPLLNGSGRDNNPNLSMSNSHRQLKTISFYFATTEYADSNIFRMPFNFSDKRGLRKAFQYPSCNIGISVTCHHVKFGRSRSNVKRYERIPTEIHLKMGHSRTIFKVNQDHGNHDRLAIENGDFGRTLQIFAPDVFNAPRG